MKLLLVLVMLTACAAKIQVSRPYLSCSLGASKMEDHCSTCVMDMSGKMFTFPMETNTAHVRLNLLPQELEAVTVCHRSFTDLKRDHVLFSVATPSYANDLLVFWDDINKTMVFNIKNEGVHFNEIDYKPNTWHSVCTTWDSESGLVQLWFDGKPSIRKFVSSGTKIRGRVAIIIGQEQDSHAGGFDIKQSFIGMMSDVHMWNLTLYPCEIQNYVDGVNFTPGNVLNWRALDFQIRDKVLVENKIVVCY